MNPEAQVIANVVWDALDSMGGTGAEAIVAAVGLLPGVGRGPSEESPTWIREAGSWASEAEQGKNARRKDGGDVKDELEKERGDDGTYVGGKRRAAVQAGFSRSGGRQTQLRQHLDPDNI